MGIFKIYNFITNIKEKEGKLEKEKSYFIYLHRQYIRKTVSHYATYLSKNFIKIS